MALSCSYGMDYGGIVLVLLPNFLEFPQEEIVPKEVGHADHDSHCECLAVFQVESFIRSKGVVGVQPDWPVTEDVGEVVLGTFYVFYSVLVCL